MKFIVSSSELQRHIGLISGAVPAKAVLPIIMNILFELKDSTLFLTATDMEITMQTSLMVEAAPDATFNLALPTKIITDTLKALPEQPLTFDQLEGTPIAKIITDNGEYKINGINGADFPRFTHTNDNSSIFLSAATITNAIDKVLFAASNDELKLAMTGMFFQFGTDNTTFVATDAHRLVRYRRTDIKVGEPASFILPSKALKLVKIAAPSSEGDIQVEFNNRNAFFHIGSTLMVCRLIDARFPEYDAVIPKSSPNKLIISKRELLSTMKRLDIYSSKSTHLGKFKFSGNILEVVSDDIEFGNEGKEKLNCLYEGEELEIGFNISLMTDVINNIDTEEVTIELDTPGRAAVVLPAENEANEDLLMLLMPVILGSSY